MANIFKTKEMIKHLDPNIVRDPTKPNVAVRGVYITGKYRPPYYIDHTLTISKLRTVQPVITAYEESTHSANVDSSVQLVDINCPQPIIEEYTYTTKDFRDHVLFVKGIDIDDPIIDEFESSAHTAESDSLQVIGIDCDLEITSYQHSDASLAPEQPIVYIKSLSGVNPTITS